jgi:hypothetical protein
MAEISPLRRRMIEDMKVRNLSPATQRCYVHAVGKFSQHFGRSPDRNRPQRNSSTPGLSSACAQAGSPCVDWHRP